MKALIEKNVLTGKNCLTFQVTNADGYRFMQSHQGCCLFLDGSKLAHSCDKILTATKMSMLCSERKGGSFLDSLPLHHNVLN